MTVKSITGRFPVLYTGRIRADRTKRHAVAVPALARRIRFASRLSTRLVAMEAVAAYRRTGRQRPRPVPGIGPCDRSRFAGTVDELKAWWPAAMTLAPERGASRRSPHRPLPLRRRGRP